MATKVTPAELHKTMSAENVFIADVRENGEYRREHISGANSFPLSSFSPEAVLRAAGPDATICVCCASGGRSATACGKLEETKRNNQAEFGKIKLRDLSGGMSAWRLAGLPMIEDKNAPLPIIRQVHIIASSLIITGSLLTYFVSPNYVAIPLFVGCGLFVSGSTGFCGMAEVLQRLPYNSKYASASC